MLKFVKYLLIITCALSVVSPGQAAQGGNGKGHGMGHGQGNMQGMGHGQGNMQGMSHGVSHMKASSKAPGFNKKVAFSSTSKKTINNYLAKNPISTTGLPPGIAMNVARGKPLPPGIQKVFLPSGLVSQLPAYPGYEYRIVGNDVVLVNSTTGVVSDILSNILK